MINSGAVAAIHLAGVRGDPCGAVHWTVQCTAPQGSPRTPATCIAASTPELIIFQFVTFCLHLSS